MAQAINPLWWPLTPTQKSSGTIRGAQTNTNLVHEFKTSGVWFSYFMQSCLFDKALDSSDCSLIVICYKQSPTELHTHFVNITTVVKSVTLFNQSEIQWEAAHSACMWFSNEGFQYMRAALLRFMNRQSGKHSHGIRMSVMVVLN